MAYTIAVEKKKLEASESVEVNKDKDSDIPRWIAKSKTPGKVYTIRFSKTQNRFMCDCASWIFGKGKACKHICAVIKKYVKNAEIKIIGE